jgi:hypothetical protein
MRDFLRHTLLWIIILMACIYAYGQFCDWFFTQPQFLDAHVNKRAWSLTKKNQKFDYAVLGNSRAYGSFDMKLINEKLGKQGINLGANGSGFVDNYLTLYLFLKNNNKIDELYLQVDIYSLDSRSFLSNAFHKYHFVQYWNDPVVGSTIADFSSSRENKVFTVFPELRYVKFNKYFSFKEIGRRYLNNKPASPYDKTFGARFEITGKERTVTTFDFKSKQAELNQKDFQYLKKILDLCRANDIKVTAYKTPEFEPYIRSITNYEEIIGTVLEVLKREEIYYIMPDEAIEKDPKYFVDGVHISDNCIEPFTRDFIEKVSASLK